MLPTALADLVKDRPAIYTIPSGQSLLRKIADFLVEAYDGAESDISQLTILLPNKRSAQELGTRIFNAASFRGRKAVLLPRLRALGDVAEEDLLLDDKLFGAVSALPPPAPSVDRRALLATLIRGKPPFPGWAAALRVADDLVRLLDTFHTEGISLSNIEGTIPQEIIAQSAEHWKQGFEFLDIIRENWPAILAVCGWIDGSERQRQLIEAMTAAIADGQMSGPILVVGSLGTVRSTGRLMSVVAEHPQGAIVLPGVDLDLDERGWRAIDPPHPQALFRERLERDFPGIDRRAIRLWPNVNIQEGAARRAFLSLALRPAASTDDWYGRVQQMTEIELKKAVLGLSFAAAKTQEEEADFIALTIREAMETPEKSVMLITPDRDLAQRVSAHLKTWDIDTDDTGGVPLSGTYRATFLRLIARWMDDPSDPGRLLAMLSHPLAAGGQDAATWGGLVRRLDTVLRGRRKAFNLADLHASVSAELAGKPGDHLRLSDELFSSLIRWSEKFSLPHSVTERIAHHAEFATWLATTSDTAGVARLWLFEDGEAFATLLQQLTKSETWAGAALTDDEPYADFFDAVISGPSIRKRGGHPRVRLMGLLEARLQTADLTILGGLVEGVWPDGKSTDGFLSRPMRDALGLPTQEQIIGRAAHDFVEAAARPHVLLTRALQHGTEPVAASRWWVRLESILSKRKVFGEVDSAPRLRTLNFYRHGEDYRQAISPPMPDPPTNARPTKISVTDIETYLRDPYAIYAKHVLKLRPMDPLNMNADARLRGTVFHRTMEIVPDRFRDQLPDDLMAEVRSALELAMTEESLTATERLFWTRQTATFVEFCAAFEVQARRMGRPLGTEASGKWAVALDAGSIDVKGRADRIDVLHDGTLSIVDFKSSEKHPVTEKSARLFSPQLHLLALMAEAGAFENLAPHKVGRITFAAFNQKDTGKIFDKKFSVAGDDLHASLVDVRDRLSDRLSELIVQGTPFESQPRSFFVNEFGDYNHLARRAEWASLQEDA